jgi:hypothetical protein
VTPRARRRAARRASGMLGARTRPLISATNTRHFGSTGMTRPPQVILFPGWRRGFMEDQSRCDEGPSPNDEEEEACDSGYGFPVC